MKVVYHGKEGKGKKKMKQAEGYVLRKLSDEFVLLPHGSRTEETEEILTLSETAAFIYEQLDHVHTLEAVAECVSKEYQIPVAQITPDVEEVLYFLRKKGIIL